MRVVARPRIRTRGVAGVAFVAVAFGAVVASVVAAVVVVAAGQVRRMLEQDFADAKPVKAQELKDRGFWFRFSVRCARLMAPIQ